MKRSEFLQKSSALVAGSLFMPSLLANQAFTKKPLGVQLFTLFGKIDQDVKGNLQKLAELGYTEIESAFGFKPGFYGLTGPEFMAMQKDLGLKWVSHHVIGAPLKPRPGFDASRMPKFLTLKQNANELVDTVAAAGVKYMVCANIPIETKAEVAEAVELLTKTGQAAKKAGLIFCYHNHDSEFKVIEGQRAFDVFSKEIPADLMKFELDLGWASKAGEDPVALFAQQPGRFPLCHLKDFDADFKNIVPVGTGIINYKRILEASSKGGIEHFFVEHDMPKDAFESLRLAKTNLDAIL
jgi:sugar phosphate isomerase/epimerase